MVKRADAHPKGYTIRACHDMSFRPLEIKRVAMKMLRISMVTAGDHIAPSRNQRCGGRP
jgi:hypothetical protein